MKEKNISFEVAKEMASASTIFTTHTPVPAGTDIFPIQLIEKYFYNYPEIFGISKNDFISMGLKYGNKIIKVLTWLF
jgi:starch phosphorylase